MVIRHNFRHEIRGLLYIGSSAAGRQFFGFVVTHSMNALIVNKIALEVMHFGYLSIPICVGKKLSLLLVWMHFVILFAEHLATPAVTH